MEAGKSFEEKLKRVEEIIAKIQKREVSLNEMLAYFEEGTKILKECREELTEVENRIKYLIDEENQVKEIKPDEGH
ncbi:MAG: exodeoxyribonuclease VII small subunit [Thermoplasmata archaeon]|nr:exodeoxyribonuclease VII small subunit [Thermoplasmata archaeon]